MKEIEEKKKITIFLLVTILGIVSLLTIVKVGQTISSKEEPTNEKKVETVDEPLSEPLLGLEEKDSTDDTPNKEGEFVLRSVGDVLIHETVSEMADVESEFYRDAVKQLEADGIDISKISNKPAKEKANEKQYDFAPMLAKIAPFTEYADATIANLEVITAYPELPISGYPQFNAPSSLLTNIKKIGVDIVSNGTNHTLDYYSEGALQSIDHICDADLMYVGSYQSQEDQQTPRIIDQNGIKVGFLTYSYGTNGIPVEAGKEFTISLVDIDRMVAEVKELDKQVDAVVVTLQLGQEYDTLPDDNQRFVFEMLSEAGVKLILGGHPHVLQPMEWYNGKETFAIYSQASFLSGQVNADNKQGGITEVTFKRQEDGEVAVTNPKFMPIYIAGMEHETMFEVVPYADYAKYQIPDGQTWWETIQARMTTYTDEFDYVTHLETARTKEAQTHR